MVPWSFSQTLINLLGNEPNQCFPWKTWRNGKLLQKVLHNGNAAFMSCCSLETLSTLGKYTRKHVYWTWFFPWCGQGCLCLKIC